MDLALYGIRVNAVCSGTLTTAAVSYWVTYSNGYPPTLATMGGTPNNPATCGQAILVDEVITSPPFQKSGYQYAWTGEEGNVAVVPPGCVAGFIGYLSTATPLNLGVTGNISYCTCEPGIIHYDTSGNTAASEAACTALPTLQ